MQIHYNNLCDRQKEIMVTCVNCSALLSLCGFFSSLCLNDVSLKIRQHLHHKPYLIYIS